jgi:hypothetical protein
LSGQGKGKREKGKVKGKREKGKVKAMGVIIGSSLGLLMGCLGI